MFEGLIEDYDTKKQEPIIGPENVSLHASGVC